LKQNMSRGFVTVAALTVGLVGACAPVPPGAGPTPEPAPAAGIPPIPFVDGLLEIRVVHPTPATVRPNADSTFIYGSTGTGRAELTINGQPVEVSPNGAFLGFLPMPADGVFRLAAQAGGRTAETTLSYRAPPPPAAAATPPPATIDYPQPRTALVTGGADTLATGSDVAIGRVTPTGEYRWFLPRGARLALTGERGDMVRAQLDRATVAWLPRNQVTESGGPAAPVRVPAPTLHPAEGWTDVRVAAGGAPFRVESSDSLLVVTVHGVEASPARVVGGDPTVALVEVTAPAADAARLLVHPRERVWGYRAFYEQDGTLVLRIRRPPRVDPAAPLRGVRIAVDPGHPPGGATGPTGLTEAEANLAIGLRLADQLRASGAEVMLTRTTHTEVGLAQRTRMADAWGADLLVSVHNNAFPEGVNPFRRNGTSTYFYHGLSRTFAQVVNEEIVGTTRVRDLGAIAGNLALVRPTWMPSILTESLFMPMPEQESALRDPRFVEQLAAAHVRGIERFLRGIPRAGSVSLIAPAPEE
jgi:N-acetylmuramoyl-L-alanine amidase